MATYNHVQGVLGKPHGRSVYGGRRAGQRAAAEEAEATKHHTQQLLNVLALLFACSFRCCSRS